MKKIFIVSALIALAALTSCSNNNNESNTGDVAPVVTGETEQIETVAVEDNQLSREIKEVNPNAVVEVSVNHGMKMIKIDLPIENDKAKRFFEQVEEIVDECDFDDNDYNEYDFYYFSTSENGNVEISVAFKKDNGRLVLDSINTIADEYKDAESVAIGVSELFRK